MQKQELKTSKTFRERLAELGPGALVAAAFIGPGTVVTASLAGANYGYALLWALVFSVAATLVLQEMAARLGVITQQGLGENIRTVIENPFGKFTIIALVVGAVVVGNSVYQGGNLSGASMGAEGLLGTLPWLSNWLDNPWAVIIGLIAGVLLWTGNARLIEKVLIGLVIFMSLAFICTFLITQPDFGAFFSGLLIPSIPTGATLTVVALIGTTVVPYNLFLHAASAADKWHKAEDLNAVRTDLFISIPLGGLISIAIVSTAASAFFGQQVGIEGAADLAQSLTPLFGNSATWLMAGGLFAAGISSAMTAPLASAYALCGVLGFSRRLDSWPFRLTWLAILIIGVVISSLGLKPVNIIWFAQVANGILLPVITVFLLMVCNHQRMQGHKNSRRQNLLGGLVLLVSLLLSARSLGAAFGWYG